MADTMPYIDAIKRYAGSGLESRIALARRAGVARSTLYAILGGTSQRATSIDNIEQHRTPAGRHRLPSGRRAHASRRGRRTRRANGSRKGFRGSWLRTPSRIDCIGQKRERPPSAKREPFWKIPGWTGRISCGEINIAHTAAPV